MALPFNRWSTDVTGALTWLNRNTGLDLSGVLGVIFTERTGN